ncbi:glycosyltransferase family 2 protein [Rhizobium sp. 57MFTsu3.2]|uniref:glycosyltransferase family 2 protein n=1 Tax=Rhizobium sp. 57MFTsu3.2 TaxID=1048681 RepID=UPI00146F5674|nr:glycosyltransferase family 2 protein [Rhizobium sp. 57MFTsu3.2]NMN73126.1 Glycosyltransferases, probably involved in cell wall biogenesis [Rhizobium sp. 57MFTsu3.2]
MNYDALIATRNRPNALQMSIPLMLKQKRPPSKLVVVDASDDHKAVCDVVNSVARVAEFENFVILRSEKRNSAYQRNLGLAHIEAPIVAMPDDDSLWHPGFGEALVAAYEMDTTGVVGGVTATPVLGSPLSTSDETYKKNNAAIFKSRMQALRNSIEERFVPETFKLYARSLWDDQPAWIDGLRYSRVETMSGFRMSFRTDVIKSIGFDETLGYGAGYSQHEDMDVSLRTQKSGYILAATSDARVFHHVFPGARASGWSYGFCQVANTLYICAKLFERKSTMFPALQNYMRYKIFLYSLKRRESFWRDVHRGAQTAFSLRGELFGADKSALSQMYMSMCDKYIHPSCLKQALSHSQHHSP